MAGNTQAGGIKVLWIDSTINFATTAAGTGTDSSGITITGASVGDPVIVTDNSGAPDASTAYHGFVSAADTVKVRFDNYSTASVDPASASFRIGVIKLVSYS